MRLIFHPKVYGDIDKIMEHYEQVATSELANEFYRELREFMQRQRPGRNRLRSERVISGE